MTADAEDRVSPEKALRMVVDAAAADPNYPRYSQAMFSAVQACQEALGERPTWTENLREWEAA